LILIVGKAKSKDRSLRQLLQVEFGFVDSGEAYKGRIGYERRMGLVF